MKKLLVVLLALTMVFAFAACGQEADTATDTETFTGTIPIGDGVEDIDISGACFGTYELIEGYEGELEEGEEGLTYYSSDSDTPYIEVFSMPKDDMTLEDFTKYGAEEWGNGYYQMLDGFGYYTCPWEDESGFYYCANVTFEGDEMFHAVCYSAKTEELLLADNVYMWVPTGYTDADYDDEDPVFSCSYEESYALPNIDITIGTNSYEESKEYFSYNGEIECTEEQYNKWAENWSDEGRAAFYEAVGYKIVTTLVEETAAGTVYGIILDNQRMEEPYCGMAYVFVGETEYRINAWCDEGMNSYPYLYTMIKSIHTK